ncbi:MAG TPA: hypothetical protein VMT34_12245 [Aggregatilineales bacterium]|nr:hypothetical protein [Aggregatilineales bacterium]
MSDDTEPTLPLESAEPEPEISAPDEPMSAPDGEPIGLGGLESDISGLSLSPEAALPQAQQAELGETEPASSSDLSRPARADEFRSQRRSQVSTVIPALLLIGLGTLYLVTDLPFPEKIAAAVAALAFGLIVRFLMNARREPGLFFTGITLLLWLGVAASDPLFNVDFLQAWPLLISAVGVGILLTVLFQRSRERRLLLPGFLILLAGIVLLPFTMGLFVDTVLPTIALLWPLVLVIPILVLLPRVIRRQS